MSHDQQAQRLSEIDDLLAECQRHDMTGVRVSYAQLRAMRDAIAAPVQPAAVAEVPDVIGIVHESVRRALDELGIRADVPRGMALEVAIEKARDLLAATPAPVAPKFVAAVVRDVREDDGWWIQEIATEGVKLDYGTLLYVAAPVAQKVPEGDFQQAIDRLLEDAWWPPTIEHSHAYERFQDDTDGEFTLDHILSVAFGRDGDAWLKVPRAPHSLRFRTYGGGGMSLRVRNALLVLAEAIRRDNEKAPQRPVSAMLAAAQAQEGK